MARELTTLLRHTAEAPSQALDTSALLTRVGRRQRTRRVAVAGTSVCAALLAFLVVVPLLGPPTVEFAPADWWGHPRDLRYPGVSGQPDTRGGRTRRRRPRDRRAALHGARRDRDPCPGA